MQVHSYDLMNVNGYGRLQRYTAFKGSIEIELKFSEAYYNKTTTDYCHFANTMEKTVSFLLDMDRNSLCQSCRPVLTTPCKSNFEKG